MVEGGGGGVCVGGLGLGLVWFSWLGYGHEHGQVGGGAWKLARWVPDAHETRRGRGGGREERDRTGYVPDIVISS